MFRVACSQSKSSEVQETSDSKSVDDEFPGWDTVVGLRWSRTPWEGTIKSVNQGGALVSVHGIRGVKSLFLNLEYSTLIVLGEEP